jgi:DNA-binding beta-propeller fold protein YncE
MKLLDVTPSTGLLLSERRASLPYSWLVALLVLSSAFFFAGCTDRNVGADGVVGVFGETGFGVGEFSYPRAIAASRDGLVYVADKTGRIQRFDADGRWQLQWFMPEYKAGKPTGLTVDPQGRVFAADTHYHRVIVFDRDGNRIGQFGTQGRGPGQFELPTKVAIDRDGFLYVGEYGGNDRISKFTPDWKFVSSFGGPDSGPAALSRPSGMVFDEQQVLWVADACNHRICRFDDSGRFLGSFGVLGKNAGQLCYPYDIELFSDGTLLVSEYGNNRLQRFDRSGRSLGTWGSAGRKPGQLACPWSAAIGPRQRVYVVDSNNNRVQIVVM